jgi:hypothetical protein
MKRSSLAGRNPLCDLPAAQALRSLPAGERGRIADLLMELAGQANVRAEACWAQRKGPMAAYWRACSTYAKHMARVVR